MVNVIKDNRSWTVTHEFKNIDCPFLYYPANYHGCKLLLQGEGRCTLENCPSPKKGNSPDQNSRCVCDKCGQAHNYKSSGEPGQGSGR